MHTTCWFLAGHELQSVHLFDARWLEETGRLSHSATADAPMIAPLHAGRDAIAAVLVPLSCVNCVSVNKLSLTAGLFALQDRDHLQFHNHSFWVSAACVAEETEYDAARHGPDVFCFMTKARLREGEAVTVCPGRPAAACGTIFKRAAWNAFVEQPGGFRCPNCSFDPHAPAWQPPLPVPRRSLAHLIQFMRQEAVP